MEGMKLNTVDDILTEVNKIAKSENTDSHISEMSEKFKDIVVSEEIARTPVYHSSFHPHPTSPTAQSATRHRLSLVGRWQTH